MKYNPEFHHRRSIRLPTYDYSQPGAYFVTVCTQGRLCLFGDVAGGQMTLNSCGDIVQACWDDLPHHYPQVKLDAFAVMPNHVHGVILITDAIVVVGAGFKPAPTSRHGLPEIVRAFKTFSSRRINELRAMSGAPVWQRNYYEHIVRDEEELQRIRQYVHDNPFKWSEDPDNPSNL